MTWAKLNRHGIWQPTAAPDKDEARSAMVRFELHELMMLAAKRLKALELAAEYWRKDGDLNMCGEGYRSSSDNYVYQGEAAELLRLKTLERFATLPHYNEKALR